MRRTGRKRLERETGHPSRGGGGGKGRKLSQRSEPAKPSRRGTALDHYQPKKDALAIPIHRLHKKGDSPRKIAKVLGISRERVDAVLR